ncbi:hypothetical protein AVEN_454-1 [Araneus ventricosus]|uniref:Uncharacterized protein n=1 Tax=Araneus ventricosus TaxID=182803 RepID=A0A4Y2TFC3_ARAVE|nr:hypothetical protein AVEN_454-1 [Araneus ventricosus]
MGQASVESTERLPVPLLSYITATAPSLDGLLGQGQSTDERLCPVLEAASTAPVGWTWDKASRQTEPHPHAPILMLNTATKPLMGIRFRRRTCIFCWKN